MAELMLYSFTLLIVFYTLYRVKKNHYHGKKKKIDSLSLYTSIEKKKELLCDAKVDHKKKGV
jgi:hypothetical protein